MTIVIVLSVLGCLFWHFAGRWEWQIPSSWESRLSLWGAARKCTSEVLHLEWKLEEEGDLEGLYRNLRRSLPSLEEQIGARLWIEVSLYIRGSRSKVAGMLRSFEDIGFVVRDSEPR